MIYLTKSVKFFNGHIFHKRIGNIDHFFKNRINALLIDLKKEDDADTNATPGVGHGEAN